MHDFGWSMQGPISRRHSTGCYCLHAYIRTVLLAADHSLAARDEPARHRSISSIDRVDLFFFIRSPHLASGKARGAACCFSRKQDWPGARREAAANQHQSGNQTSRQTHFEIYTPVSRAHYIYVVTWRIFFPVLSDCSSCFCATNARRALRETTVVISLISWQHGKGFTC
jgi:hypothetical protein